MEYFVTNRQMPSQMDEFRIEQSTLEQKTDDLEYRLHGALIQEQQALADLQELRSSVEEIRLHVESFGRKVSSYNERFKDDFREGFGNFLEHLQSATKYLIKMLRLGAAESVDVDLNVENEMLQTIDT